MTRVQPFQFDLDDVRRDRSISFSVNTKERVMIRKLCEHYEGNRVDVLRSMIKAAFYQVVCDEREEELAR